MLNSPITLLMVGAVLAGGAPALAQPAADQASYHDGFRQGYDDASARQSLWPPVPRPPPPPPGAYDDRDASWREGYRKGQEAYAARPHGGFARPDGASAAAAATEPK